MTLPGRRGFWNAAALCTAGTVLVFVLVYWAVYALTARTYCKIIS